MIGVYLCKHHMMMSQHGRQIAMSYDFNKMDLSEQDMAMIEAALQTQKKILSVQNQAGGADAAQKLTELKHLMRRLGRVRPQRPVQSGWTWSNAFLNMRGTTGSCSHSR